MELLISFIFTWSRAVIVPVFELSMVRPKQRSYLFAVDNGFVPEITIIHLTDPSLSILNIPAVYGVVLIAVPTAPFSVRS